MWSLRRSVVVAVAAKSSCARSRLTLSWSPIFVWWFCRGCVRVGHDGGVTTSAVPTGCRSDPQNGRGPSRCANCSLRAVVL